MRTEKAIQKRIKLGEETSKEILNYLKENPDKTIYDLSKAFGWSIGKVQKALLRIDRHLRVEQTVESGKFKKKYRVSVDSAMVLEV